MDLGSVTLALAVLGFLGWLAFLLTSGRVRARRREAAPQNLTPHVTDDEMESRRLNKILVVAVLSSALLAFALPIYYLSESERQASAAENFEEEAIERGAELFQEFQCGDCHGPAGVGGGAEFVEKRSGINTTWAAPSLNDVLFRYAEEEVRFWIVFGRAGTPMPAWGLEGGGPLNGQQIDELIAYLQSIQLDQEPAVAAVDGRVQLELSRLDEADDTVQAAVDRQLEEIERIKAAAGKFEQGGGLADGFAVILAEPGSCTEESAGLVDRPCDGSGIDTDRDGLTDVAEGAISSLSRDAAAVFEIPTLEITLDPGNRFSTTTPGGAPVEDLDLTESTLSAIELAVRDARLTAENEERLLATAQRGLDFLEAALAERRYAVDFEDLAARAFDGDPQAARRAAGLFHAYCARCHTAGYSAGVPFTQEPGSGAFAPSLRNQRARVQFPDSADHLDFVIKGSNNGKGYGVNGIGTGRMPGFGTLLSRDDLLLIVKFERALE
ncbi:MAG: c-type cytochrome [Acidimicrobiia bacterium]